MVKKIANADAAVTQSSGNVVGEKSDLDDGVATERHRRIMCHQPHWLDEGLRYKNTVKGVLMVRVPKGGLGSATNGLDLIVVQTHVQSCEKFGFKYSHHMPIREPSDPIRKRVIGPGAGGNTGTLEWRC
ncbi:MAG: hypothetical protein LH632_01475 [Rhodoferax sp.]|nr:hypothetical protein [Rhodoferax sp.]